VSNPQGRRREKGGIVSVAVFIEWPGVTAEQYDLLREQVGWEREVAQGSIVHIACSGSESFRVVDVWESEEAFERFVEERLMPGAQQLGLTGQPTVQFYRTHVLFAPGL
jgi:hypothetical protein